MTELVFPDKRKMILVCSENKEIIDDCKEHIKLLWDKYERNGVDINGDSVWDCLYFLYSCNWKINQPDLSMLEATNGATCFLRWNNKETSTYFMFPGNKRVNIEHFRKAKNGLIKVGSAIKEDYWIEYAMRFVEKKLSKWLYT